MRRRIHLLVFLFYLAVTLVITYPLITVIGTRMIGHPFGDAYEYTHHIWWIKTALQTGQNPFFMPNLLYPDGLSATLLWSLPLQSFPAWLFAFVMPLPAAFNVATLLTLALNGWAMFALVNHLVRDKHGQTHRSAPTKTEPRSTLAPALVAGLVFMLYPAFQGQLGAAHTGLLTLWPAPLYLTMLLRLREDTHIWRTVLAGAILFMVSLWGSVLLLIYLIAPITAIYFAMMLAARDWRTLRRGLVTVALGGILALPFVVPLAIETLHQPPETGSVTYSAALLGVVSPSFYHPLFTEWDTSRRVLGVDPFEQASYVGVIAGGLGLLAVWKRKAARWWLATGAGGVGIFAGAAAQNLRFSPGNTAGWLCDPCDAALGAVPEFAADQHCADASKVQFRGGVCDGGAGRLWGFSGVFDGSETGGNTGGQCHIVQAVKDGQSGAQGLPYRRLDPHRDF